MSSRPTIEIAGVADTARAASRALPLGILLLIGP